MLVVMITILLWMVPSSATEFLYPVASITDDHLLVMYQKNPNHIELWHWNPQTHQAQQALLSRFTPAGVRLLPSKKGYSFIDDGIIKIHYFHKRSPKTVECDAPLYNIEFLHWLDEKGCYTHARYRDTFGIFEISSEGEVYPLVVHPDKDCMYPQIVGETIYYIERHKGICSLKKHHYMKVEGQEFVDRLARYEYMAENVIEGLKTPYVFLFMPNETCAFMLSHPPTVSKKDQSILFSYHCVTHFDEGAKIEKLFDFTLPSSFIFSGSSGRLYEALLPFIPRHNNDQILYSSLDNEKLGIFVYSQQDKKIYPLRIEPHEYFFAPLIGPNTIYLGGLLSDEHIKSDLFKFDYESMVLATVFLDNMQI